MGSYIDILARREPSAFELNTGYTISGCGHRRGRGHEGAYKGSSQILSRDSSTQIGLSQVL